MDRISKGTTLQISETFLLYIPPSLWGHGEGRGGGWTGAQARAVSW